MEHETVIKVENLHKKFCRSLKRSMLYGTTDMVRDMLGLPVASGSLRKGEFWSLQDVNFELNRGDSLGVIGVNGSGKSTLLRLLTGIFPPDKGSIAIKGKVGSLIAVGAGFHPHMSGRENIYLNGIILGMKRSEIEAKFDQIVQFADIGEFLEAPVSTYSSGMRVRLGFAIAIHCEPDILLVDEILSVGDLSFRNKSLRHMAEYRARANALIFVSHDIEQVRMLCNKLIILDHGQVVFNGDTQQGIIKYEEMTRALRYTTLKQEKQLAANLRYGIGDDETLSIERLRIVGGDGAELTAIGLGDHLRVECEFELKRQVESLSFYVSINRDDSEQKLIVISSFDTARQQFTNLTPGRYSVVSDIAEHHLAPGVYNPNISFRNDTTFETYQKYYSNLAFQVQSDGQKVERGAINVDASWQLINRK